METLEVRFTEASPEIARLNTTTERVCVSVSRKTDRTVFTFECWPRCLDFDVEASLRGFWDEDVRKDGNLPTDRLRFISGPSFLCVEVLPKNEASWRDLLLAALDTKGYTYICPALIPESFLKNGGRDGAS